MLASWTLALRTDTVHKPGWSAGLDCRIVAARRLLCRAWKAARGRISREFLIFPSGVLCVGSGARVVRAYRLAADAKCCTDSESDAVRRGD